MSSLKLQEQLWGINQDDEIKDSQFILLTIIFSIYHNLEILDIVEECFTQLIKIINKNVYSTLTISNYEILSCLNNNKSEETEDITNKFCNQFKELLPTSVFELTPKNKSHFRKLIEIFQNDNLKIIDINSLYQSILTNSQKKNFGKYYTPPKIAYQMVQIAHQQLKLNKNPNAETLNEINKLSELTSIKILDPACGTGNFLIETINYYQKRDHKVTNNQIGFFINLSGVDIDRIALIITLYRLFVKIYSIKHKVVSFNIDLQYQDILVDTKIEDRKYDIILGNPPYLSHQALDQQFGSGYKDLLIDRFDYCSRGSDYSTFFIEMSLKNLKPYGVHSFIISNKWIKSKYGKYLRDFITKNFQINKIVILPRKSGFQDVTIDPLIYVFSNLKPKKNIQIFQPETIEKILDRQFSIKHDQLLSNRWLILPEEILNIFMNVKKKNPSLKELGIEVKRGVTTGCNDAFIINYSTMEMLVQKDPKSQEIIFPVVRGRQIYRYNIDDVKEWIIFSKHGIQINDYPAVKSYLESFKRELTPRPQEISSSSWEGRKPGNYKWYEIQDRTDYYEDFQKPKIISRKATSIASFALDTNFLFILNTSYIITSSNPVLLSCLNSSIGEFYLRIQGSNLGNNFEPKQFELIKFPFPKPSKIFSNLVGFLVTSIMVLKRTQVNQNLVIFIDQEILDTLIFSFFFNDEQLQQLITYIKQHLEINLDKYNYFGRLGSYKLPKFTDEEFLSNNLDNLEKLRYNEKLNHLLEKIKESKTYDLILSYAK